MAEPMIRIQGLYKIFGAAGEAVLPMVRDGMGKQELLDTHGCVLGLQDINLSVPPRCIQVVMGLSGSGKSTLIRHINRLIAPTAGEVIVDGTDVAGHGRRDVAGVSPASGIDGLSALCAHAPPQRP